MDQSCAGTPPPKRARGIYLAQSLEVSPVPESSPQTLNPTAAGEAAACFSPLTPVPADGLRKTPSDASTNYFDFKEPTLPTKLVCKHMMDKLPEYCIHEVWENYNRLQTLAGTFSTGCLPTGDACSGTGLVSPAVDILFECLFEKQSDFLNSVGQASLGGDPLKLNTLWSCEINLSKQRWLSEAMLVPKVFKDIRSLWKERAGTADGQVAQVDDVVLWSCGFSCESVSRQHNKSQDYVGCIKSGAGKTGYTYSGAKNYIAVHLPFMLFLENVGGLSKQDRAQIVSDLETLGYMVIVLESDVADRGVPAHRIRVYFIASLNREGDVSYLGDILDNNAKLIELYTQTSAPVALLSDYLVPEEDPLFPLLKRTLNATKKVDKKTSNKKIDWVQLHSKAWREARDLMPKAGNGKIIKPKVHSEFGLTPREKDALQLHIARNPMDHVEGNVVFIDVSQSLYRLPHKVNISPTIMPGGKMFLVEKKTMESSPNKSQHSARRLFGIEALRLQGLFETMVPNPGAVHTFSNAELQSLAGNAFSAVHVQLAMLVMLTAFRMPTSMAEIEELRDAARKHRKQTRQPCRRWRRASLTQPLPNP